MSHELQKVLRPTSFKTVYGNESAVTQLKSWLKSDSVPHCILFQGPSGCGKTTLARILAKRLNCSTFDLTEINAAGQARGIERIKAIESQINLRPIEGDCKVYLIDEAHKLTNDAQNAMLKMLEEPPKHVYFFLCTTEPQKLIKTIKTRSSVIQVKLLADLDMVELVQQAIDNLDIELSEEVIDALVKAADGSARKCLVILDQIRHITDESEQMSVIGQKDVETFAIDLCRALMNPRAKWPDISKILATLEDEAENVRWAMLGYASSVILKGGKMANRAFVILDQFSGNYFDTKKAGLIADCWEVVHGRKDE